MIDLTLADTLLRFVGRLHPALVHFPIALFIVAALLEVVRLVRRKPEPSPSAVTCVVIGAATGVAVAFSGWMNADFESHAAALEDELFWHRWLGVGVAAAGVAAAGVALGARVVKAPAFQRVYALLLLGVAAMVGLTGHFGGSMVYGPAYLVEIFRTPEETSNGDVASLPVRTAPADAVLTVDFARHIQPIFDQKCVECHGPSKSKGKLRLDTPGQIFSREEGLEVVIPKSPDESELLIRVLMKKGEEGRMPPKGDPLPGEQVELIRRWIAEGAYWTMPAAAPAAMDAPPAPAGPEPAVVVPPSPPAPAWTGDDVAAIEALRAIGGRVEPIAAGSSELDINLSVAGDKLTDEHFSALARLAPRIKALNLARTPFSDAAVGSLKECGVLETLRLEETKVTDKAIETLARLPRLRYLNLNGTGVTDAGMERLAPAKSLENLYVSDTAVTLEAAIKLQGAIPAVNIELGIPKP